MTDPNPRKFRKGVVDYNYDVNTSRGNLDRSKTPIYVDQGDKYFDEESSNKSITLVHQNLLPTIVNDIVIDSGDDVQNTLYHNYTHTLKEYAIQNSPLVCSYNVPASGCPVELIHTFDYLNDRFRNLIRDAIRCICYLHEQNLSMLSLDLDTNFVVHGGRLKLYQLSFCNSTTASKRRDFIQLSNVLDKLFDYVGNAKPKDVQHLIKCMRQYSHSREDYVLLSNHMAVLPTDERLGMIRNFYEKRRLLTHTQYVNIFEAMDCDLNWTAWFDGSKPGVGPAQDCYDYYGQDPSNQGQSVYFISEDELYKEKVNRTAIRFCRDMVPHLPEHMYKHLPTDVKYTQLDLDLIIMHAFVDQLLSFQKAAHHSKWLLKFL